MHLFSAPALDPLKSLHILILMGHDDRAKNCKLNQIRELWGESHMKGSFLLQELTIIFKEISKTVS